MWCGGEKGEKYLSVTGGFCVLFHTVTLHQRTILHDRSLSVIFAVLASGTGWFQPIAKVEIKRNILFV